MSSVSRLTIVLVCAASLAAAQIGGLFPRCPSVSASTDLYGAATSNCSAHISCASIRCGCLGGTYNSTADSCTPLPNKNTTCSTASPCQLNFINCMNYAANTVACLSNLKLAIMAVMTAAGTNPYNGSTLMTACQANTCGAFNYTVGSNCTLSTAVYPNVCLPPITPTSIPAGSIQYTGQMTLGGNWVAVLASPPAIARVLGNCTIDFNNEIPGYGINCTTLTAGMASRRSGAATSAIISFTANAASNDPTFMAAVTNAVSAGTTWLSGTQNAFFANGGTGTFTLVGISETSPINGTSNITTTPAPTKGAASATVSLAVALAAVLAFFA
jgi:hypothetical protein